MFDFLFDRGTLNLLKKNFFLQTFLIFFSRKNEFTGIKIWEWLKAYYSSVALVFNGFAFTLQAYIQRIMNWYGVNINYILFPKF